MEKKLLLSILALCTFAHACKKDEKPPRKHDFNLMPIKDARWYMHCQGEVVTTPAGIFFDSAYHNYSITSATGRDTLIEGKTYFWYDVMLDRYHGSQLLDRQGRALLFRQDTVTHAIYIHNTLEGVWLSSEITTVDFSGSGQATEYYGYRNGNKSGFPDGDITLDGLSIGKWSADIKGRKVFYKARGVGGPYGICGRVAGIEGLAGIPRSLDFVYKGDSLHFDYGPID